MQLAWFMLRQHHAEGDLRSWEGDAPAEPLSLPRAENHTWLGKSLPSTDVTGIPNPAVGRDEFLGLSLRCCRKNPSLKLVRHRARGRDWKTAD